MKRSSLFFFSVLNATFIYALLANVAWAGFGVGTVYGTVTNYYTGEGIGGATLEYLSAGSPISDHTFPDGTHALDLLAGNGYIIKISKPEYKTAEINNFNISPDGFHRLDVKLKPAQEWNVTRCIPQTVRFLEGNDKPISVTLEGRGLNLINHVGLTYGNVTTELLAATGNSSRQITVRLMNKNLTSLVNPIVKLQSRSKEGKVLLEKLIPIRFTLLKKPQLTAPEPYVTPETWRKAPRKALPIERRPVYPR